MDRKSTKILLSILHICILGICILTIYSNKNSASDVMFAHVSSDTKVIDSQAEPEPETNAAPETETAPITETETAPEPEPITEPEPAPIPEPEPETEPAATPEPEISPLYFFDYVGTRLNLNIRSAPSMSGAIIGKVPVGGGGNVIELTNDEWALIDYQGVTGYCSRNCIRLREPEK